MCNNLKVYYYTTAKTISFQVSQIIIKTICLVNTTVAKNNLQSTDTQLLTATNYDWMVSIAPRCCLSDIYHIWPPQQGTHTWSWETIW